MKQTLSRVDYMNFFFFFLKYPFPRKSSVKDENFMRIEKRPDEVSTVTGGYFLHFCFLKKDEGFMRIEKIPDDVSTVTGGYFLLQGVTFNTYFLKILENG